MKMIFTLMLLLLMPVSLYAADSPRAWDKAELLSWVGKYPSVYKNGKKGGFLYQPSIQAVLHRILSPADRAALASYDVEDKVEQQGDFLVVHQCMPHNCPAAFAMVIIDLNKPRLWVGFFERQDNRVSTRWFGNVDDYSILPAAIKNRFTGYLPESM
ncbi:MAG TPA: hypothetical protein VMA74_05970 [Dyella sp.]|uniref:hypothetical protein n=1 Tax=Dyella sp. TaxID=1869338 RepID=UPI002B5A7752|nr:hypothetical protein [Dyella sp.]HUB89263.1 hypothetical protein [Dyella sp.]